MLDPIKTHSATGKAGAAGGGGSRVRLLYTTCRRTTAVMAVVLFMAGATSSAPAAQAPPVNFMAYDVNGRSHPAAEPGASATVWVFIAHDCPICNGYAPELARTAARFGSRGVRINIIYCEPDLDISSLRGHAAAHGYKDNLFADLDGHLARDCGITITPEVAIVDNTGAVVYRGRIDNRFVSIGHERNAVSDHTLDNALDALLAGRPVNPSRTSAVGCALSIP